MSMSLVYIESDLLDHPYTQQVLKRLKQVEVVEIDHYGEVFNRRAQNFRLQKKDSKLIIARKHRGHVLAAPEGYGLGGQHNYYFSHMLNCIYDCRYCFLQGMYQSANQVLFVNYDDFAEQIRQTAAQHADAPVWFYSGYDCDSLAFDPVTGFIDYFLPVFAELDNAWLEIRSKSTQIRALLKQPVNPRVVTAFSFSDAHSHAQLEHGVPSIAKRIKAMKQLQEAGWPVGLRLDPLVHHEKFEIAFKDLLAQIFETIDASLIHSVSLGTFRLTRNHHRNITRLYPDEPLFAQATELNSGIVSYPLQQEQEMMAFCEQELMHYIPASTYHPCEWHD